MTPLDADRLRALFAELQSVGEQCADANLRTLIVGAATVLTQQHDALAAAERERDSLKRDLNAIHHAIKDIGAHPGRTDDLLTDIIRSVGAERDALAALVREVRDSVEPRELGSYLRMRIDALAGKEPTT